MPSAFEHKLCTEMNGPIYWGHVPNLSSNSSWLFSVSSVSSSEETEEPEEAPTEGRRFFTSSEKLL